MASDESIPMRVMTTAPKIDPERIAREYAGIGPHDAFVHSDNIEISFAGSPAEELASDMLEAIRRYRRVMHAVPALESLDDTIRAVRALVIAEGEIEPEAEEEPE